MGGKKIEIELNQRRRDSDTIAARDERPKALALQGDGVDTDVHQDLDAFLCSQGDGVPGGVNCHDFAFAWRQECGVGWIDRDAVADHFLRKNGIGNALKLQTWPLSGDRILSCDICGAALI